LIRKCVILELAWISRLSHDTVHTTRSPQRI